MTDAESAVPDPVATVAGSGQRGAAAAVLVQPTGPSTVEGLSAATSQASCRAQDSLMSTAVGPHCRGPTVQRPPTSGDSACHLRSSPASREAPTAAASAHPATTEGTGVEEELAGPRPDADGDDDADRGLGDGVGTERERGPGVEEGEGEETEAEEKGKAAEEGAAATDAGEVDGAAAGGSAERTRVGGGSGCVSCPVRPPPSTIYLSVYISSPY